MSAEEREIREGARLAGRVDLREGNGAEYDRAKAYCDGYENAAVRKDARTDDTRDAGVVKTGGGMMHFGPRK